MKRLLFGTLFVASALAVQLPAHADSHEDARRRYQQGVSAFAKGDFSKAVDDFAAVYQTTGETKHLWNLALAEYKADRSFDALVHLREYVAKADANPKNVERARGLITETSAKVGHVTVVAPEGASVLLDGASAGTAPLGAPLDVDPVKPHVIVAQRGSDTAKQSLPATGATSLRVELAFPVPAPATPVAVLPAATPAPAAAPASAEATSSSSMPEASSHGSALRTWMTVGLGVGALAALGGGVAMGLASNSDANHAQQLRSGMAPGACVNPAAAGCSDLASATSSATSDHTAAILLYSGAGVLAAGALASFLFLPHGQSTSDVRGALFPIVTPGGGGAGYVGVF